MIRVSADLRAALDARAVKWARIIRSDVVGLNVTDHPTAIVWAGVTYNPSGLVLESDGFTRSREIQTDGYSLQITNADSVLTGWNLANPAGVGITGQPVTISAAIFAPNGAVGGILTMYRGVVDAWAIHETPTDSALDLELSSHWSEFGLTNPRYATDSAQQALYPGDNFFDEINTNPAPLDWGV